MLNLIVSSLAVALAAAPVPVVAAGDDPAIEVWMSGDRRFRQGERARIQIDTRVDGYLLVLHYDTDGRVNVLFPIAPGDDAFIRSGRRYEIRDERDKVVQRPTVQTAVSGAMIGKGEFRHFMLKEIYEQPAVIGETLASLVHPLTRQITLPELGIDWAAVPRLTVSACGTALLAGQVT